MFSHLFNTYKAVTPPPKSKQDIKQEIYQETDSDTLIIDPLGLGPISRVPNVDKPSDQPFIPDPQFSPPEDQIVEAPEYSPNNQLVTSIINTGRSFVGGKYVSGGTSPETGFDCSGFLQYIFKQNGVDIPRDTSGIFKVGKEVSLSNVQPGDIICSRGSGPSGRHVQMVSRVDSSNNQIYVIEAKGKKWGIVEGPLTKKSSDIISIRRVLNQSKNDPFLANQDVQKPTTTGKFSNKKDFIKALNDGYRKALSNNGLNPDYSYVLTAQAAMESGWGKHPEKASDESNLNFPIQPTIAPAPIPVIEKPQQMTYQPTIQVPPFDSSSLIKIDIEDLLRQEGITSINGKAIKFGNKAVRSANASYGVKNSNHKKKDPHTGNAMARDISIVGGTTQDYADFRSKLLSNPKVVQWFDAKGWGIINEITPAVLRRTRGTGPHFHFGPDSWAKRTWKAWVSNPNLPVTQAV